MTSQRFVRIALKALAELPEPLRRYVTNIDIVVKRRPGPADYRRARGHYRLYGLYDGVPLGERGGGYGMVPPDKITIFREPLQRDFPDEADLIAEIRKTVLHEVAHFFGLDEPELKDLGID
jgi:predicted Zn-dependent protease with MMP-like domain